MSKINKTANSVEYIKDILYPVKNNEISKIKSDIQSSRNLTMANALSSTNEEVVIDGSGYTGKTKLDNGAYDSRQVKIVGKNIVFTDDAWKSCRVAIGELLTGVDGESAYGINAETIIGDIIIGNNLRIISGNGEDLLSVIDNKILAGVSGIAADISLLKERVDLCVTQSEFNIAVSNMSVDHVVTSTGYTFDDDGLTINKTGQEMKNLLDNTGMYVTRSNEEVLSANNNGVTAINLSAKQYLIIGNNSRFENYSNGTDNKRTACFYIGGQGGVN